jgi:putative FmdB family regulatory protein
MPIYEYLAEQCRRQPSCTRRLEYIQPVTVPPLSECRECGAPIRRIFSSFAAKFGAVGVSSPDPTPLNMTGIPTPSQMPSGEGGGCGHDHSH